MSDFTPINTQEEFDAAIQARLKRERESTEKKFDGWLSPDKVAEMKGQYETQISGFKASKDEDSKKHLAELAEKDKAIAEGAKWKSEFEKVQIAVAAGIPIKYASRLVGTNADEWKKDAEEFAKGFTRTAPIGGHDPAPEENPESRRRAAFRDMLKKLEE